VEKSRSTVNFEMIRQKIEGEVYVRAVTSSMAEMVLLRHDHMITLPATTTTHDHPETTEWLFPFIIA